MAGETGTVGATGSEFPVFKSTEGAFDRAKYKEQEKAMVETDGVSARLTGKEIDEDLKKKKVSAEDATKKASKFYDESYDKNIKDLDPAIDRSSVYYDNAYSGAQSDRNEIRRRIEKGEALDGKEIFEMSKDAAKNKIANINILKKGTVTEIVENIGLAEIKKFDLYEDVKSDFDSKIKDDKLKFEPMLTKISKLLSYFNDDSPMASQYYSKLFTPENNAILSALAKILNGEGFESESVVNRSKKYKEDLDTLAEKSAPLEFKKIDKEDNAVSATGGTGATGTTSEQKLEDKKSVSATGPTGSSPAPLEGNLASTGPSVSATPSSTGPSASTSSENLSTKTGETKTPEAKTAEQKLEEKKPEEKKEENKQGQDKEPITTGSKDVDKIISDVTGIDISKINKERTAEGTAEGTTEVKKVEGKLEEKKTETKKEEKPKVDAGSTSLTTSTGTSEEKITTGHSEIDKMLESILPSTKKSKSLETEKKIEETKLGEKTINTGGSETLKGSTPIKETTTQNLSSAIIPEKEKDEVKKEETKTYTPPTITNENTIKTDTETKKQSESEIAESKTKTEEASKSNEEMNKDLKSMISLLSQLNNTLRNPLIVIPSDKKFH